MNHIRATNIQRMCFHDGPGIRTTVFLKGCSLHCPWCSNPENINYEIENEYGIDYSTEQLYNELIKDRVFWEEKDEHGLSGGVTFSGGEPLIQATALKEVLMMLKNHGISVAVESSMHVPYELMKSVIDYIDYVIVDVKILDNDICDKILGGDLKQYYDNIAWLYEHGKINLFRVPCCVEYTMTVDNKKALLDFLGRFKGVPVEIFKIHQLAESKYKKLGIDMWRPEPVTDSDMNHFLEQLTGAGVAAKIVEI